MYITVTPKYKDCRELFKIDEQVTLRISATPYDIESISVIGSDGMEVGYVANSVDTVVVGTHSAGYLNASYNEKDKATIRFITREFAIAEL